MKLTLAHIKEQFKTRGIRFARPKTGNEVGIHVTTPDSDSISEALGRAIRSGFTAIYIHKTQETIK
jgi:hypothetical protein